MLPLHADALHSGFATAKDALYLVLPFAASESACWWPTMQALAAASTPHLRALLKGMGVVARDAGPATSLSPPHERLLARELGWQGSRDGLLPWAAWQQRLLSGQPPQGAWAWVNLCHWAMGREHATLSDPAALNVQEAESRQLLEAMRPFFEEDGIHLHYQQPLRWLAQGQALAQPTASLDRVLGRNVDAWLPATPELRTLRRLQNEMQMLLYTHAVNEERQQRRLLPVNSVWFSGSGELSPTATNAPNTPAAPLHVARTLAPAALAEDWPAYAQAWAELDATAILALLKRQQAGQTVRLSLCGERASLTLQTAPKGLLAQFKQLTRRSAWPGLLQGL